MCGGGPSIPNPVDIASDVVGGIVDVGGDIVSGVGDIAGGITDALPVDVIQSP